MSKKQIVVVYGGDAWNSYEEYFEYLKNYELTQEKFDKTMSRRWKDRLQESLGDDFTVVKLKMPCSRNAKYEEWAIWFTKILPYIEKDAVLLGHSLGASFLAKFLSENTLPASFAQLYLVSGCFGCGGGFELSEDLGMIEKQVREVYIYHSHDDPVVDFADAMKYKEALPSAELVEFDDRHHFIGEEFPEIVAKIKEGCGIMNTQLEE